MPLSFIHKILILEVHHRVNELVSKGYTDQEILKDLAPRMSDVQRLIATSKMIGLKEYLEMHYPGCYKYVKILEVFTDKIADGSIEIQPNLLKS